MSVPSVNITELDGQLGVLPNGEALQAFAGPATAGPLNTPAAFARTKDVIANFGPVTNNPLVEAVCYYINRTGKPALVCRTGNSIAGSKDTIDVTGVTGTSVATANGSSPTDDCDLWFKVVVGGTVGTAGITYQVSLDGGKSYGAIQALGTATTYSNAEIGGAGFAFAAGTLVAGDIVKQRMNAPNWNSTELQAAIDALRTSAQLWEIMHVVGPVDATAFDTLSAAFGAGNLAERAWHGHCRKPQAGETEATYLTAMTGIFGSKANTFGGLTYGAARIPSPVSGRSYRRSPLAAVAALLGSVSAEVDIADTNLGSLPVSIRDNNGNPVEHDELINPGADDARFIALRTIDAKQGVYVNNPNLFSPVGSDFQYFQHRRVMNIAKRALRLYFTSRLSKPVLVNATTGFILETEALEIERGATVALESSLMARPMASAVSFTLSRTDNILSTKTLTGQGFVTPLAYPKTFNIEVGYRNPALQILKA
jgi:hypothetical protein